MGPLPLPNGRTPWLLNVGDPNWDDPPSMVPFPAEKQQVMGGFHGKSEVGNDCLLARLLGS